MHRRSAFPSNQFGGTAVTVLLVLGVAAVLFLMVIHTVASLKRTNVLRSWETTLGTFDDVMRRHPATETNAQALDIERIATSLGVDIVPRTVDDRLRPGEAEKGAFEGVKTAFAHYMTPMLEQPALGLLDEPPEEFRAYLARHDDALRELRATLAAGRTAPIWYSDISELHEAPVPNLLGHINLVKLMTSAALERLSADDETTALEYLDASWQLANGLRDSPILITQLITIAETRMLLGALRHVDRVPGEWLERLEFDYRGAFLQSMKYGGWLWVYLDTADLSEDTWWQKAARPVVSPYATYCLADVSGAWRERIENLERVESICDYDLSVEEADLNIPVPRWNLFGEILVPNLANAIHRLSRLELDIELTRLTIQAKRNPFADGEITPSLACTADSWETSVRDGELRIAFSRGIEWPNQHGAVLPTHAVLRATGAEAD